MKEVKLVRKKTTSCPSKWRVIGREEQLCEFSISLPRRSNMKTEETSLETVDLDSSLGDTLFDKEVGDLQTLITLELDNLPSLFVVNESTVACEFLESQE